MDWLTYSIEDFIPYTPEVYLRLLERINDESTPWQLLAFCLPFFLIWLIQKGRLSAANFVLSLSWLVCAITYFHTYFKELNWAATYIAGVFIIQAILMNITIGLKYRDHFKSANQRVYWLVFYVGTFWPAISVMLNGHWSQAEFFALHPDSTAIVTLGFILLTRKGWPRLVLLSSPLLWCVVSSQTLSVLNLPQYYLLSMILILILLCWVIGFFTRGGNRTSSPDDL